MIAHWHKSELNATVSMRVVFQANRSYWSDVPCVSANMWSYKTVPVRKKAPCAFASYLFHYVCVVYFLTLLSTAESSSSALPWSCDGKDPINTLGTKSATVNRRILKAGIKQLEMCFHDLFPSPNCSSCICDSNKRTVTRANSATLWYPAAAHVCFRPHILFCRVKTVPIGLWPLTTLAVHAPSFSQLSKSRNFLENRKWDTSTYLTLSTLHTHVDTELWFFEIIKN